MRSLKISLQYDQSKDGYKQTNKQTSKHTHTLTLIFKYIVLIMVDKSTTYGKS